MKKYTFVSANMGDITIERQGSGYYGSNAYDLYVYIEATGADAEFTEIDAGSVDEVFKWLIEQGVKFPDDRALWFNAHYVASVMLDHDATTASLLHTLDNMSDQDVADWRNWSLA